METFKGAEVAPINEMLERTIFAQGLRAEIQRLTEENELLRQNVDRLANIGLDCAEEANDLRAERDDLAGKLEAAQEWMRSAYDVIFAGPPTARRQALLRDATHLLPSVPAVPTGIDNVPGTIAGP